MSEKVSAVPLAVWFCVWLEMVTCGSSMLPISSSGATSGSMGLKGGVSSVMEAYKCWSLWSLPPAACWSVHEELSCRGKERLYVLLKGTAGEALPERGWGGSVPTGGGWVGMDWEFVIQLLCAAFLNWRSCFPFLHVLQLWFVWSEGQDVLRYLASTTKQKLQIWMTNWLVTFGCSDTVTALPSTISSK